MSIQDMTAKPTMAKRPNRGPADMDNDSNLISKLLAATPLYLYHGSVMPPGFFSGMLRQLSSSLAAADQKTAYSTGLQEPAGTAQAPCSRIGMPYPATAQQNSVGVTSPTLPTNRKFDIRSLVQTDSDPVETTSRKRPAENSTSPLPKRPRAEAPPTYTAQHPMQQYFDAMRNQNGMNEFQLRLLQQQLQLTSLYQNSYIAQQSMMQNADPTSILLQQHSEWRRQQQQAAANSMQQQAHVSKAPLDLTGPLYRQDSPAIKQEGESPNESGEETNENVEKER